jgi:DNA-directed RNA polymerase
MLFDAINKSQQIGWQINKELLDIIQWALRNKTEAFSDIWEQQNPEARTTKLRESRTIIDIAKKFVDKHIYHLYYYDFR